jgi:PAS domain S-box-containing protein
VSDKEKTQEQLVEELQSLRRQVAELQENGSRVNAILKEQIAERERAEEALVQERSLLHALLDNLPDHLYFKDTASRFIRISRATADWFGLSDPAQAAGKTDLDFFTEEHAQPAYADEQEVMRSGQPLMNKEEKETWPDGRETWVSTTKMPLRDSQGHIVGTFGVSRDITALKRTEESLAEERNLLRTVIDTLPDYIYVKDAESRFVLANMAVARNVGVTSPDELRGKTDFDFNPPELAEKYYALEQGVIHSGQPVFSLEEEGVDQAGNRQWGLTNAIPWRDSQGKIVGLVGITHDITELKRVQEALAHERDLLRALMDNLPDTIYFKDADSRFIRINKAQAERFGLSDPAQAVGKTDFDFFTVEHAQPAYADEQAVIKTGQPLVGKEEKETWPDGRETWVSTTKVPLRDNQGHIVGTFGVSRDITELKRSQESLVAERNLLRTLIDNLPDYIYAKDVASRFVLNNAAHMHLLGAATPGEIVGKMDFDFFPEELSAQYYADEQEVIQSGQPLIDREERVVDPTTHKEMWNLTTTVPLRDSAGLVVGLVGISRDITERRRMEARLERRAVQLQAAAEVARDATTARDLDELLNRAVNLVRDRFGFYHAGIFLVDDQGEYAILTAATGEAGRAMLERGHKLRVGEVGIVGYVAGSGQPRIALDVGADAVHFRNPFLPETRSEMALPLKVGGRVIGVLDVQSEEASAFDEDDVRVLQTMADQLAVAIESARLLGELQASLREASILYQRYSQEAWSRAAAGDKPAGYVYDRARVVPMDQRLAPEVLARLQAGRIVTLEAEQNEDRSGRSTLIAPIMLRGQVIGAIGFEGDAPDHSWSPEDLAVVEAVTNQVALALENARLLEEAQRRASRERLASAVTARMRETLDMDTVLQTAIREMGEALGIAEVEVRMGSGRAPQE